MRKLLLTPVLTLLATCTLVAQNAAVSIDPARSTMTVYAYKSGIFSFAAHDHEVAAPIAEGQVITGGNASVRLRVDARQMKVLDPKLDAEKRAEVQKTMLSEKVLDVQRYPSIEFASTQVRELGSGKFRVTGTLNLHGMAREIAFDVTQAGDKYSGSVALMMPEFGIPKIVVLGGTVKVKDRIDIRFDIATESR